MRHLLIIAAMFLGLAVSVRAEEIPNTAILPAPACEKDFYNWSERHEAVCAAIREKPVKLVFVGDSITHLWGGTPKPNKQSGDKVWQEFYTPRHPMLMA